MDADIVVIGAGVIGLAISCKMSREGYSVIVLEKEAQCGTGVSSRNTETIHAGIYYKTGSLKAVLCRRGRDLLYDYCENHGIQHKRVGKLFLAVTPKEVERLALTRKQALENGVDDVVELDSAHLAKLEPNIKGVAALLSPSSGIFDTHAFMKSLFTMGRSQGVMFAMSSPASDAEPIREGWSVKVGGGQPTSVACKAVINAAGLYATAISKKIFPDREVPELYPTKGSYLRHAGKSPTSHIIYPAIIPGVVEERVDATPDLAGSLRFGPNIEEPKNLEDFSIREDLVEDMAPGIRRYLPDLDFSHVGPDCSGIRPKIYGPGQPVEDFRFEWADNKPWLDLWGIESPGLTAALSIADHVYGLIKEKDIL